MNNLVTINNNRIITTSRQVAEHFGKEHMHIMESIRKLLNDEENLGIEFSIVKFKNERGQEYPEYLITKKGFTILAFGFTGKKAIKFKLAYIDQFEAMEEQLRNCNSLPNQAMKELNDKVDNLTKLLKENQSYKSIEKSKQDAEIRNEINSLIKDCSDKFQISGRDIRLVIYKNMKDNGYNLYSAAEKLNSTYYMEVAEKMGWLEYMKELTLEYIQILQSKYKIIVDRQ